MSTKTAKTVSAVEDEIVHLDEEIGRMEAELVHSATTAIAWDDVNEAAVEELVNRERRRAILPRLIKAAKIKRLELRIMREQRASGPLEAERAAAHERLEEATAKRWEAVEEENAARALWSRAHNRIERIERRIRDAEREISALRGEA